jgi:hypothetical protein
MDTKHDKGMVGAHHGIGGGYVVETPRTEVVAQTGSDDPAIEDVVRQLKDQGAEVVFEGTRPDGTHRRF